MKSESATTQRTYESISLIFVFMNCITRLWCYDMNCKSGKIHDTWSITRAKYLKLTHNPGRYMYTRLPIGVTPPPQCFALKWIIFCSVYRNFHKFNDEDLNFESSNKYPLWLIYFWWCRGAGASFFTIMTKDWYEKHRKALQYDKSCRWDFHVNGTTNLFQSIMSRLWSTLHIVCLIEFSFLVLLISFSITVLVIKILFTIWRIELFITTVQACRHRHCAFT